MNIPLSMYGQKDLNNNYTRISIKKLAKKVTENLFICPGGFKVVFLNGFCARLSFLKQSVCPYRIKTLMFFEES
ncbi:hypothetical protein AC625_07080 [Peribacillus loiseleuriae]|uniref:Uncharacterized protein n=1 Tax=Peribacillus loiseleuriae TaxID=1679170 RepID=A0A0K9GSS2_9BACI|nr:hypothetical protein AC625_07080 [Peribacillus loiseleuriae]